MLRCTIQAVKLLTYVRR